MQSRRIFIGKVASGLAGTLATAKGLGANERIRLGLIGAGDRGQPDSSQAFTLADRTPRPLTEAADFPGPVLALWTSGASAVTVVVRDLRSQQYSAYVVSVVCAN